MFEHLVILMSVAATAYGGIDNLRCKDGYICIPLSECSEVRKMIDDDLMLEHARSLLCGYFHEPYVCCVRDCTTPNGNYGHVVLLKDCTHLEIVQVSKNRGKEKFLNDSYLNSTHVCCNEGEDSYIAVPAAPVVRTEVSPEHSQECITPNGETENCVHVSECNAYLEKASETDAYFRFINDSFCGYWKEPMICCGTASDYKEDYKTNLPTNKDCGIWDNTLEPNIPPWLAWITSKGSSNACVGALINKEYVLATVKCVGNNHTNLNIKFGQCINDEAVSGCSFQVNAPKIFPLYKYLHSEDLGIILLKLSSSALPGTDFIPVCLPTTDLTAPQSINIVGLEKDNLAWTGNTVSASTMFNDDCQLPPYLRLVCMRSTDLCGKFNKEILQNFVLINENNRWYLQGLFNKEGCYGSTHDLCHAIHVYKFVSWINSNVS